MRRKLEENENDEEKQLSQSFAVSLPPKSPSRLSVSKSLQKRGLADELISTSPPRIEWKRTALPASRGTFEASNLLGNSGTLVNNQVTKIQIIQIEDNVLQSPIECTFRVKTPDELIMAVSKKLDLKFVPKLFYCNDIDNEDMQITDISILPSPAKIKVVKPNSDKTFLELLDLLKTKVAIKDRRYLLKTYPNCFIGYELVDCIIETNILGENVSRQTAVEFGHALLQAGYFGHVVDPKKPFKDKYLFYRFTEDQSDDVLNISTLSLCTYVWGRGSHIPTTLDIPITFVSIACGSLHTIALSAEGKVYSWGVGKQGQLGLSNVTKSDRPLLIFKLNQLTVQAVYAGYNLSGAKTSDFKLFTWGSYLSHCNLPIPKLVTFPELNDKTIDILSVAFGYTHCGVLFSIESNDFSISNESKSKTEVFTWGCNNYGQLGIGAISEKPIALPSLVTSLSDVTITSIDAGVNFTVALSMDGAIYAWGTNTNDILNVDSKKSVSIPLPKKVRGIKQPIEQIACGCNYFAAVTTKGKLLTWGSSERLGCIGLEKTPKVFPGVRDVSDIACGDKHMLIRTNTDNIHALYSVGNNTDGQLGFETGNSGAPASVPKCIRIPVDRFIQIAAGRDYSCAIISEDMLEVFIAAAQKFYGNTDQQFKKLMSFVQSDPTGCVQVSARKILRLEKRHLSSKNKKKTPWSKGSSNSSIQTPEDRFIERSHSRSVPSSAYDKQHFELFQHSSIYSINISKYELFDKNSIKTDVNEQNINNSNNNINNNNNSGFNSPRSNRGSTNLIMNSTYKFLCDEIVLNSGGCANSTFKIIIPKPSELDYSISVQPMEGNLGKDNLIVFFQIVAFRPGNYESLIYIDFESEGLQFRHILFFNLAFQTTFVVPEFSFASLDKGELLGSGAAGTVTKKKLDDGREVAVKFFRMDEDLSVEEINSFRNEMMISSNLTHPNIIDCLGVCTDYPHLGLVLEFFPLKDLRNLISKQPHLLSCELIIRISIDIVEGMMYLHHRMVIHRDLKPDNVLMASLDPNSETCAKLTDFGTSKVVSTSNNASEVGTARYMPLEVLKPDPSLTYDFRMIDVYSFGISKLFEIHKHIFSLLLLIISIFYLFVYV